MTTTARVHEMSFLVIETDIPAHMSIAEYRRSRARADESEPPKRGRRGRIAMATGRSRSSDTTGRPRTR